MTGMTDDWGDEERYKAVIGDAVVCRSREEALLLV
jgi:hypothetical protein